MLPKRQCTCRRRVAVLLCFVYCCHPPPPVSPTSILQQLTYSNISHLYTHLSGIQPASIRMIPVVVLPCMLLVFTYPCWIYAFCATYIDSLLPFRFFCNTLISFCIAVVVISLLWTSDASTHKSQKAEISINKLRKGSRDGFFLLFRKRKHKKTCHILTSSLCCLFSSKSNMKGAKREMTFRWCMLECTTH